MFVSSFFTPENLNLKLNPNGLTCTDLYICFDTWVEKRTSSTPRLKNSHVSAPRIGGFEWFGSTAVFPVLGAGSLKFHVSDKEMLI